MECQMERTITRHGPEEWDVWYGVTAQGFELCELLHAELGGPECEALTVTIEWLDTIAEDMARDRRLWGGGQPLCWDAGPLRVDIEVSDDVLARISLDVVAADHDTFGPTS